MHRLGHANPWLWRLHGVHHVPEKVNVANNGVNHVFDIVLAQSAVQLALDRGEQLAWFESNEIVIEFLVSVRASMPAVGSGGSCTHERGRTLPRSGPSVL